MSTTFQDDVIVNATETITSASATAFTVAVSGNNYGLQVDESNSSAATGLKITPAAQGSGLALSTRSSGTNENLKIDAKGSGTITIGGTSSGDVILVTAGAKVGIGTASPGYKLHIISPAVDSTVIRVNNSSGLALFTVDEDASGNSDVAIRASNGTSTVRLKAAGDTYFNAGNVGMGTQFPASRLDLAAGALTLEEMTAPSAPAANKCVIYAEDNGSGKTRLMVRFATGAAQQIAIEP